MSSHSNFKGNLQVLLVTEVDKIDAQLPKPIYWRKATLIDTNVLRMASNNNVQAVGFQFQNMIRDYSLVSNAGGTLPAISTQVYNTFVVSDLYHNHQPVIYNSNPETPLGKIVGEITPLAISGANGSLDFSQTNFMIIEFTY